MSRPALVVSLHDVSPLTHPACAKIIGELAALGVSRTSLLVIPDHHHRGHFAASAPVCEWLRGSCVLGHEPVIHGYFHQRLRREKESAVARLTTRVYTAGEGEFFDIDRASAKTLVENARREFQSAGLNPTGFIAPAWLLSSEGEAALRELDISYTTRLGSVLDLRNGEITRSQSLVWSVRSGWRRISSVLWNATLFRRVKHHSLVRISIHPVDVLHPTVWRQITGLVKAAARSREVLTYSEWIARERRGTGVSSPTNWKTS